MPTKSPQFTDAQMLTVNAYRALEEAQKVILDDHQRARKRTRSRQIENILDGLRAMADSLYEDLRSKNPEAVARYL